MDSHFEDRRHRTTRPANREHQDTRRQPYRDRADARPASRSQSHTHAPARRGPSPHRSDRRAGGARPAPRPSSHRRAEGDPARRMSTALSTSHRGSRPDDRTASQRDQEAPRRTGGRRPYDSRSERGSRADDRTGRSSTRPHPSRAGADRTGARVEQTRRDGDAPRDTRAAAPLTLSPLSLAGAAIALIVVVVLAFCFITGVGPFAGNPNSISTSIPAASSSTAQASSSASTSASSGTDLSADQVTSALEKAGVEDSVAEQAGTLSESDDRFKKIAANIDAYATDGSSVLQKLVTLAVDDPKAIDFVETWPDDYPSNKGDAYTEEVTKGTVPQLYQWDARWGYTVYSGTTFALTGCCPTSLSMVYMGLTGSTDKTPYTMGQLARSDGFETATDGTDGAFLTADAAKLGLTCTQIDVSTTALKSALDEGAVVICNVGPGDFTTGGHYFVIVKMDGQSQLTIRDPYSSVRSAKTWDADRVLNQTIALYAFTAAS